MDIVREYFPSDPRTLLTQCLSFAGVVCSALMIWKTLMIVTACESPIVVVLSGSMEPSFYRGDLLSLHHDRNRDVEVGEIVVFSLGGRDIPIVHRVLEVHRPFVNNTNFNSKILTKGDNNPVHDRGLYDEQGRMPWLRNEHIIGRVTGGFYVPYLGMVTIIMNDYPMLKYILIGALGVMVITTKE
mmetsp:Transcript_31244/g.87619  ORF Transcript_31244/g.87619 Transcript_31244/m.87619 type:complete len:185 (+) Transcript_31244:294-848(+)